MLLLNLHIVIPIVSGEMRLDITSYDSAALCLALLALCADELEVVREEAVACYGAVVGRARERTDDAAYLIFSFEEG